MPTKPVHTLRSKRFVLILSNKVAMMFVVAIGIAQQPRQGVSVQMATTTNATPMPAADEDDAWVIAITADGRLYFGTKQLTPEGLSEQMKATPRRRDQNLYIKADARAPYSNVKEVLATAKEDSFESSVLLTTQHEHVQPGTMVLPRGLKVFLSEPAPGSETPVVEVHAGDHSPILAINEKRVAPESLKETLAEVLRNQDVKTVTVKADGQLAFEQLAQVIDTCHAAGAKVILPTPEL